ncbi:AdoMet-dependent rRNA methyltransferase spb1 [Glugoides intestinalis]
MAIRKQRLDKYYNLAKEKGYRARSAFKLIELNRKFNFLSEAHIAVDLCAAPGGWMQILEQQMPAPRKIIGIDLDPIKPLGSDTISFVGDITTVDCRRTLIRYLEGHQVDVFVHDGAPNFGVSKDRDKYVQNDLVLYALKLATEFLKEGGSFVTKIFRSENFIKITNVLEKLFGTVDITKPLSSRSESAEIFAVCRGFKDPEYLDPNLLNADVLFYDHSIDQKEKKMMLLSDFIKSPGNKILKEIPKIIVDFKCDLITDEHLEMFKDLQLIHDIDFKKIGKLKAKIIKEVKKKKYEIAVLDDLISSEEEEVEEETATELATDAEKVDEINKILNKKKKKRENKSLSLITTAKDGFYNDRIFKNFGMCDEPDSVELDENIEKQQEKDEISVESCSDSMEMTESEIQCAIMMKKMGDKFIESTIDKAAVDSDDLVLPCEQRKCNMDEFNEIPKKFREYVGRKKSRAVKRTKKAMEDVEVENEEDEAVVYKKIFKSMYKKQRSKPRILFPKRKSRIIAPSGKGKIKCLDSRMKHDLRINKLRKTKKRS